MSPSSLQAGEIWVGTSNRLVYLTRDSGGSWNNVSPSGLAEPTQILYVEASHNDPGTAYLTVGGTRESTPAYVARTHDYGQSWQKIVNGFPEDEMVRVVREDPKRKGLLYAGTDTGVFISWDDGDHWQPLSLNLPASPVTDLEVHANDLVISTFGRGLWILDDVSPLREFKPEIAAADMYLFPPATSMRVRWQTYQDTPYPIETPAGQNPPDGSIIDYFLKTATPAELTLTIYDEKDSEIVTFSSQEKPAEYLPANVPDYWFAPAASLSKAPGVNRFVWDLRYPPPATLPYSYYGNLLEYTEYTFADHTVPSQTPRPQPRGPIVVPGKYTAVMRYSGRELRQSFTVELDPRVHASASDLREQRDLALVISRGMKSSYDFYLQVVGLRKVLAERQKSFPGGNAKMKDAAERLDKKIAALEKGPKSAQGFGTVNRDLARLIYSVETADVRPGETIRSAAQESCAALKKALTTWQQLNAEDIPSFNSMLAAVNAPALPMTETRMTGCGE